MSRSTGSIKALLVGINKYAGAPLRGCVNDVEEMQKLLSQRYGVSGAEQVKVLLDGKATTKEIEAGLSWLAEGAEEGDVRLFHYSGHGSRLADSPGGDEKDGWDECLVPVDTEDGSYLRDDVLAKFYKAFHPKAHLVLVMDSCHSGTVQKDDLRDVAYRFVDPPKGEKAKARAAARLALERRDAFVQQAAADFVQGHPKPTREEVEALVASAIRKYEKKTFGVRTLRGNSVLLAGCRPDQTSADARFGNVYQGALTYYLLEALAEAPTVTYGGLVEVLGDKLEAAGFSQEPQLESTKTARGLTFLKG